jgi:hypothetical protein
MALTKVTMGLFKDFAAKVLAVMQNHSNIFLATAKAATGTFVDFDIPAGVKRITVMFDGVSTNESSNVIIRIGAGSVSTSEYFGSALVGAAASTITSQIGVGISLDPNGGNAAYIKQGFVEFISITGNTWVFNGAVGNVEAARFNAVVGSKTLTGTLDRIRITTVNGTDQFDAGTINVSWEF